MQDRGWKRDTVSAKRLLRSADASHGYWSYLRLILQRPSLLFVSLFHLNINAQIVMKDEIGLIIPCSCYSCFIHIRFRNQIPTIEPDAIFLPCPSEFSQALADKALLWPGELVPLQPVIFDVLNSYGCNGNAWRFTNPDTPRKNRLIPSYADTDDVPMVGSPYVG